MKLKVIKTIEQYNEYCNLHEKLIIADNEESIDEIELLELLIEDFDNKLEDDKIVELNPVELLRTLLRDANLSQTEFSKSIGISKQLISDILNYRRNISKEFVLKLSEYFAMSQIAFSRKYDLITSSKVVTSWEKIARKGKDDLKIIEGIGPKTEAILFKAEIYTYETLAETPPESLTDIMKKANFKSHFNPVMWIYQSNHVLRDSSEKIKSKSIRKSFRP